MKLIEAYAALYDVTPDWYPFVGPRAGIAGYADFSGGSGHGFKIAPAIGRELARLAADREGRGRLPPVQPRPHRAGQRCSCNPSEGIRGEAHAFVAERVGATRAVGSLPLVGEGWGGGRTQQPQFWRTVGTTPTRLASLAGLPHKGGGTVARAVLLKVRTDLSPFVELFPTHQTGRN